MEVKFYDLQEMLRELEKVGVKQVRLQSVRYRKPVYYGEQGNIKAEIPHMAFEIYATARVGDEIWTFLSRTGLVEEYDKRKMNKAKAYTEEAEKGMEAVIKEKGFEVAKGRYE